MIVSVLDVSVVDVVIVLGGVSLVSLVGVLSVRQFFSMSLVYVM